MRHRPFIPKPGERYLVEYLEQPARADGLWGPAVKKQKEFADLQEALDFYSKSGADCACLFTLTVSGNIKAKIDMRNPFTREVIKR